MDLVILDNNLNKIKLTPKIMGSRLFWFYIKNTSKSYGVSDFTEKEKGWIINENVTKSNLKVFRQNIKLTLIIISFR